MIKDAYFKWLVNIVMISKYRNYIRLLKYLHDVEFTYTIDFDENRLADGLDLRSRFAYEENYSYDATMKALGDTPCSLLEVLIALSVRCEEHIMEDVTFGNRTPDWFWHMIINSGLIELTDRTFTIDKADTIVTRILDRTYGPCGENGLFSVRNCYEDFRDMELWYQLMKYLDEYIEEETRYDR